MKILDWNVWCDNKTPHNILQFILHTNADVVCLQEISESQLEFLKNIKEYNIIFAVDFYVLKKEKKVPYYLAILSKKKIISHKVFKIDKEEKRKLLQMVAKTELIRDCIYADIKLSWRKKIRIFNVHFDAAVSPKTRLKQLKTTIKHFYNGRKNIICGDFNTCGVFHINLAMSIATKYSIAELFQNEKKVFEKEFEKNKLINIYKKKTTFPKFALQLDYVLVPREVKVNGIHVMLNKHGSDHRPLITELEV